MQDEENGDDKVSNFSDESDDVDVKTKIFREIRCIYYVCMYILHDVYLCMYNMYVFMYECVFVCTIFL